jgi:hypothetical protein
MQNISSKLLMPSIRRSAFVIAAALAIGFQAQAQTPLKIAVTDLAYTQSVAQYFAAASVKTSSQFNANRYSASASQQSSGTYVEGTYSYLEQRELGSYTNDIKGALLRGTTFRLVQGKGFDIGAPQPTKAEQVLNQVKTGKMAQPVRQPEVKDIIARIRKGEFNGADYVLFGTLSSAEFRDSISPLQGSTSASHQFSLDILADFSLINTKSFEIRAAFSAQGAGNDTKLLSNRGDVAPPNRAKVMRETSQSLAANVYEQLAQQLGFVDKGISQGMRPTGGAQSDSPAMQGSPQQQQPQAIILR